MILERYDEFCMKMKITDQYIRSILDLKSRKCSFFPKFNWINEINLYFYFIFTCDDCRNVIDDKLIKYLLLDIYSENIAIYVFYSENIAIYVFYSENIAIYVF